VRSRRRARTARARRRDHWLSLWARAPIADAVGFVWRRRRLRVALLVLAVLLAIGSGGWVWLRHSSLAAVQRVQISGVHGADAGAIDAALNGAARHMSTLDVHLGALRAAVAPFTVVRDVQATASFPHTLRIRVRERLPVAALEAGGTRTAVAADGVVLGPALLSGSLPTVTASTAPAPGQHLSDSQIAEALAVLGAAPAPLAALVSKAYVDPKGIAVVMRSGLTAYFGDASRPHAKWMSLALVLASQRSAGAAYIDVRVPARPAAGYAPGSGPPPAQKSTGSVSTGEGTGTPEATAAALAAGLSAAVGRTKGESASAQGQTASENQSSKTPGSSEESSTASSGEAQSGSPAAGAGSASEGTSGTAHVGP
jgi:cell division protein FtsQ